MLLGIKRIYDKVEVTDGTRILVDGLWPRGVRKSTAHIDKWIKEVAPSAELRKWFSHDPERWEEFKERYKKELARSSACDELVKIASSADVTFIYSSRDTEHNNAIVLAECVNERLKNAASKD